MNTLRTTYRLTLRFATRTEALPVPFRGSRVELVANVKARMTADPALASVGIVKTGAITERFSFERGTTTA